MTERLSRKEPELQKEIIAKEGRQLINELFIHLQAYEGYRQAAGLAYPKERRDLEFDVADVGFQVNSRTKNVTQRFSLVITGKLRDDKEVAIRNILIVVNGALPESPENEIVYEAKQGDRIIDKEKDNQKAINKIRAISNGLQRKKPSSRSNT